MEQYLHSDICFYFVHKYKYISLSHTHKTIYENDQQDAIYYSLAALHVSSDIFTHHQKHLLVNAHSLLQCVIPEAVIQFSCW
jgi:hypothetical protein